MKQPERQELITCTCDTEALVVDLVDIGDWREVWIAFWRLGQAGRGTDWRCRLRHVWQVIRHGTPYADMVCLEPKKAQWLGEQLIEAANMLLEENSELL